MHVESLGLAELLCPEQPPARPGVLRKPHEIMMPVPGSGRGNERMAKMPAVSSSVERVPHSRIRELAEIAMGMDGVLRLYFGESNLPTPDYIKCRSSRPWRWRRWRFLVRS